MKRGGNKNETTAILTPKKTLGLILQESLESLLQTMDCDDECCEN